MLMAVIHILENKMKFKRFIEYCHLCKEKIAEHNEIPFGWSKEMQEHSCKVWTEITNKEPEPNSLEKVFKDTWGMDLIVK